MNIQWFPGHMAKSNKLIRENIKLADVVLELTDARIPFSSKNPDTNIYSDRKKNIVVLNKCDLADPAVSAAWVEYYRDIGVNAFLVNSITGKGIKELLDHAKKTVRSKEADQMKKGRVHRSVKIMVIGIPNVGKSAFINAVAGKKTAKTSDKPGVTRQKQWVRLNDDFSLLDMPGVLWPKFENETIGYNLAFTGAIKDDILDVQTIALKLIERLREIDKAVLENRYGIMIEDSDTDPEIYEKIAKKRGFILKGNEIDFQRCANILLDEFRGGSLGKISLEVPCE